MTPTPKAILKRLFRRTPPTKTRLPETRPNLLILVYDSCRYDSAIKAHTPVLDQYASIHKGFTPATYTYPAHHSFFCGIFPAVPEPVPYYNRFVKQLIALEGGGDGVKTKDSFVVEKRADNIIVGLSQAGYYTVGSAGANWFVKPSLRLGFDDFHYTHHARALDQIGLILESIEKNAKAKNFLGFINFMETHAPYMHYDEPEYNLTARKKMSWPPACNSDDADFANKLHSAQIKAVEYLDSCLPTLFTALPKNTVVMLFADHGEAFGEDGYWGHGVYHEKVMEVPIAIFSLNPESPMFHGI
jgi:membrane-anchored protein YejM (alkaline phosphatase superfamily)